MSSRDIQSNAFLSSDAINDDFFIDIVERKLNLTRDKFKLRLVFIAPATGKNENYVSVVYRAKISIEIFETKERKFIDVIIKALLTTIQEMKEFSVFEREIFLYEDILESFEKIWIDATGEEVGFGPKCIKVTRSPFEIIVLDDLKVDGFEMLNRKVGLDFHQAKMVLSKLAKFHAASAIRFEKDGIINEHLDRLSLLKNPNMNSPEQFQKQVKTFGTIFDIFTEAVIKTGYNEIVEKVKSWDRMKLMTVFLAVAEPMKCGLKVLNHGDSWLNNILFKSNENGESIEMKYIDYQLSFWGSPASDLGYFFISSIRDDVKVEHFDDLIVHYHNELTSALKQLKYEKHIPTLSELHTDLLEKNSTITFFLLFIMFVAKYDSNEELSMEGMMDPEKFDAGMFRNAFFNANYLKALKSWLPFLNKRGFLDGLLPNEPLTPFMQTLMDQMQQAQKPAEFSAPPQEE